MHAGVVDVRDKESKYGIRLDLFGLYATYLSVHPFVYIHRRKSQNAACLFYISLYNCKDGVEYIVASSSHLLCVLSSSVLFPSNLIAPSS